MTETPTRSNLGRGLAALFGEESEDYASLDKVRATKEVAVEHLHPNPRQPRQHFDDETIRELADSIRANGILQPILVRRHPDRATEFEIVAGERRWRAAQAAQLHRVPVAIRELSDEQALELSLVENVQRQDLSPLEEARAYRRLVEDFDHTQQDLARVVGKSRSHIANTLRLLDLPDGIKALLERGELTAGHARALLNAEQPEQLARQVIRRQLNVRQTERLAQRHKGPGRPGPAPAARAPAKGYKDADTAALERDLSSLLGLKVSIVFHEHGGSLTIHYQTLEQLDDVLHRLHHGALPRTG